MLSPAAIRHGELWRLVSWPFVQDQPLTLLFGGLMLYSFGNQLAYDWGEGRFLWTFVLLTVGAAILTVALAFVWTPLMAFGHVGMWPPVIGLLLMWSLRYPDQQMSFWGVLPMSGRTRAILVVAGTVLYGRLAAGASAGCSASPRTSPHFSWAGSSRGARSACPSGAGSWPGATTAWSGADAPSLEAPQDRPKNGQDEEAAVVELNGHRPGSGSFTGSGRASAHRDLPHRGAVDPDPAGAGAGVGRDHEEPERALLCSRG